MKICNGKIVADEKELIGGGVALLVKDTLTINNEISLPEQIFTIDERASIEIVGASVKLGNKNINLFSLYNPPDSLISEKLIGKIYPQDIVQVMATLTCPSQMCPTHVHQGNNHSSR